MSRRALRSPLYNPKCIFRLTEATCATKGNVSHSISSYWPHNEAKGHILCLYKMPIMPVVRTAAMTATTVDDTTNNNRLSVNQYFLFKILL